jgi:hypothetical protein
MRNINGNYIQTGVKFDLVALPVQGADGFFMYILEFIFLDIVSGGGESGLVEAQRRQGEVFSD